MIWPEQKTGVSGLSAFERANGMELLQDKLQSLKPDTDLKGSLRSRALDLNHDLLQARWPLIEQQQAGLPVPLLAVLVSWLAILCTSFGLFASRSEVIRVPRRQRWEGSSDSASVGHRGPLGSGGPDELEQRDRRRSSHERHGREVESRIAEHTCA